jgi:hypothetical protein
MVHVVYSLVWQTDYEEPLQGKAIERHSAVLYLWNIEGGERQTEVNTQLQALGSNCKEYDQYSLDG